MINDLLTIPEFAEIVELKPQGIYKQATNENSRLYPYVVYNRGKRYIKKEALFEVYQIDTTELDQKKEERQAPPQDKPKEETKESPKEQAESGDAALIEYLKEELRARDRQIEQLHRLLFNQQELHAKDKALLLEYQAKERQEEAPQTPPQTIHDTVIEVKQQEEEAPKKKSGWLRRIFFGE